MRCEEHDYVLYDRVWHICRHCDNYYRETRWQRIVRWLKEKASSDSP